MWDEESLVQYLGLGMCYSLSTVQCDLQDSIVIARLRSEGHRNLVHFLHNESARKLKSIYALIKS